LEKFFSLSRGENSTVFSKSINHASSCRVNTYSAENLRLAKKNLHLLLKKSFKQQQQQQQWQQQRNSKENQINRSWEQRTKTIQTVYLAWRTVAHPRDPSTLAPIRVVATSPV
jgi:hypothetical protein